MVFCRCRWSIGGLLLTSALLARADVMPATCSEYLGEESALIDLIGAEGAKLALPHHLSQVTVRYGEALDKASLRFLLNGEDVTALFQDNPDEGVFGDGGAAVQLPLNMGGNVLRVSGYLQGDIRDAQWRHCDLPPLHWQKLSIIREPIKVGTMAETRKLTLKELRALTGKKKLREGEL